MGQALSRAGGLPNALQKGGLPNALQKRDASQLEPNKVRGRPPRPTVRSDARKGATAIGSCDRQKWEPAGQEPAGGDNGPGGENLFSPKRLSVLAETSISIMSDRLAVSIAHTSLLYAGNIYSGQ